MGCRIVTTERHDREIDPGPIGALLATLLALVVLLIV
jgi:hypothetical protein